MFVLETGVGWKQLPCELLGVSGVTCWRRMRNWTEAGVWPAVHELLPAQLRAAGALGLNRYAVDGLRVRALKTKGVTTSVPTLLTGPGPAPSTT